MLNAQFLSHRLSQKIRVTSPGQLYLSKAVDSISDFPLDFMMVAGTAWAPQGYIIIHSETPALIDNIECFPVSCIYVYV